MKIIITESQYESLLKLHTDVDEVKTSLEHFENCFQNRIKEVTDFRAICSYKFWDKRFKFEVGDYPFESDVKSKLLKLYDLLESRTLPSDKNYVIIMHKFLPDYKMIKFDNEEKKKKFADAYLNYQAKVYLRTPFVNAKCDTSEGDTIIVIVRNNTAITTFFHRSGDGLSISDFESRQQNVGKIEAVFRFDYIEDYIVKNKEQEINLGKVG